MDLESFDSRRSVVYGRKGMVATSQPLATAAGLEVLRAGGNAADAAVAVAAALNVTEPSSTGIGGDMFALWWDGSSGAIEALNGSGRCPRSLDLDRLQREGLGGGLPPFHPYTVTVPGACAGWFELLDRHGRLPPTRVFAPAIELAEEGFPVAPVTSWFWKRGADRQLAAAINGGELTIDGRGPEPGEFFRNSGLASTLRLVAEKGPSVFYEGEIAESIVATLREAGGCLDEDDLANHDSSWEEPISLAHGDLVFHECPPNGQGLVALLALSILNGFDLDSLAPLSAERLHLEIEALRLAFADARRFVADPAFRVVPVDELLSEGYAKRRRAFVDPRRATADPVAGSPLASSDTVYFCVVDGEGNACSFINSNYMGFGTGIVPKGRGFSLQNRGHNFSMERGGANALEPGKRPYHTIIPALITRGSGSGRRLFGAFGVMGGFMQPQGHLQVGLSLAAGEEPQTALDRPRFCIDIGGTAAGGPVLLEEGIPWKTAARLAELGHEVRPVAGWGRAAFGRGQAILRSPEGLLSGGSDPRADGLAMPLL
ncbi:MAG TPA: gamma-glutamyltransferase family protein [Rectinemataceae bacterium]|nr:gamma-glutamyltransferase family protein [Rectinemataceae bacterium]